MEDDSSAGAVAGIQGLDLGVDWKASDEALAFMSGIEPAELLKCTFPDSLVTVSEGGRDLGKFTVTVEVACRVQQPCMLLHAQSQGAINDSPCGTTVTAYLTTDLEVLEEDYHEYVKVSQCTLPTLSHFDTSDERSYRRWPFILPATSVSVLVLLSPFQLEGRSLDRRCHMVQHDGQMLIDKVTTVGEETTMESVSHPMSVLSGLVTEGSNLLLMRLIALKKKVPEHMTFICLDQGLRIIRTTFSELAQKQLEVGDKTVEVFGVERIVHTVEDGPTTWQCYFLADGHMASRVQVGSPVTMRLLQLQSQLKEGFEKIPLVWEEDMEMRSKFLDRKEKLKADHASYLRQHPEIRALISDFLQFLLLRKPNDVFQFAREYFLPFASRRPPEPSLKAPSH
ncbi:ciliogenesis-associated TTC17-interacting protein isoform X1 [Cyclopterus lumpus]|uniref:ciliogenesis-associated TTC17-interacting protein isoform X1 n=1 Tax=Cyclopterus lumpus TaxID=8103 RepID=UPI0014864EF4|nr:ciliogenesis-associated TTC17-interacting protein isoform X1 [Cyclopterus lumpus]